MPSSDPGFALQPFHSAVRNWLYSYPRLRRCWCSCSDFAVEGTWLPCQRLLHVLFTASEPVAKKCGTGTEAAAPSQGFAFQEAQKSAPMEEKRGQTHEPQADVKLKKNEGKSEKPETFDQGHVEPQTEQQAPGQAPGKGYMMSQPSYTKEYCESVAPKHKQPSKV